MEGAFVALGHPIREQPPKKPILNRVKKQNNFDNYRICLECLQK